MLEDKQNRCVRTSKAIMVENRVLAEAEHILRTKATVREVAKKFGVSKSTVHIDVTDRLSKMDMEMANEVGCVLAENKDTRHLRGGAATKKRYEALRHAKNGVE